MQLAASLAFASQGAPANIGAIRDLVPRAEVVGTGRMSFLLWDLYDATLHAPDGNWDADAPYALTLSYLRDLRGRSIALTSTEEIRRLGEVEEGRIESWREQMEAIFPDVSDGVSLTGIRDEAGSALFYRDSALIGRVDDPDFSRLFFGIWLDERTIAPDLRAELLGGAGS